MAGYSATRGGPFFPGMFGVYVQEHGSVAATVTRTSEGPLQAVKQKNRSSADLCDLERTATMPGPPADRVGLIRLKSAAFSSLVAVAHHKQRHRTKGRPVPPALTQALEAAGPACRQALEPLGRLAKRAWDAFDAELEREAPVVAAMICRCWEERQSEASSEPEEPGCETGGRGD